MNAQDSAIFLKRLTHNNKGVFDLLGEVYEAFGCILVETHDDGAPSCFSLGVQQSEPDKRVICNSPTIGLATGTSRELEAITHELLHLKLPILGYPKICQNRIEKGQRTIVNEIINIAEHRITRPMFLLLGFASEKFLSPQFPVPTELVKHCEAVDAWDAHASPKDFWVCIRDYLESCGLEAGVWGTFKNGAWHVSEEDKLA